MLGPLEVHQPGKPLPLGQPRSVLAILLTSPNTIVSLDRFVDELWPDHAPPDARALVHGYLSRLRRALRASADQADSGRLITRKPGYLLRVEAGELDQHRYEQLLADARAARDAGRLGDGLTRYRQAQQLWRGDPYADVPPHPPLRPPSSP